MGWGGGKPLILEPKSSVFEIALVNVGGRDTYEKVPIFLWSVDLFDQNPLPKVYRLAKVARYIKK